MITDEQREWLENLYEGFSKVLFAEGEIHPMYMVAHRLKNKLVAEVIPPPPSQMSKEMLANIVAKYARVLEAEFILFISEAWQVKQAFGEKLPKVPPSQHPDREEIVSLLIGDPSGPVAIITGKIQRAQDQTPYLEEWEWMDNAKSLSGLVLPFTD